MEYDVPASKVPLNPMTIVRVDWILGLILFTAVVLIVSGFGFAADAVLRLTHEVAV